MLFLVVPSQKSTHYFYAKATIVVDSLGNILSIDASLVPCILLPFPPIPLQCPSRVLKVMADLHFFKEGGEGA